VLYDFFAYNSFLNVGCDAVEAGFGSEVVVRVACLLTTTSLMLGLQGCVGVDDEGALVQSSSRLKNIIEKRKTN